MTTSRVIRSTKGRIFLYVCAVLIMTGLIACFNSTLTQLDELKRTNEMYRKQEENLSMQLQVISEYKQKLEKTIKNEKAEHQKVKGTLEEQVEELKNKYEKVIEDSEQRFKSLDQEHNILKANFDDFKSECSKNKDDLEKNVKEINEQLKNEENLRQTLKTDYEKLQALKDELELQLKSPSPQNGNLQLENAELKQQLEKLKEKCGSLDQLASPLPSSKSSPQMKLPDILKVLAKPAENQNNKLTSKSTTETGIRSSQGALNGARPIILPTTPDSKKSSPKKLPEGVVAEPPKSQNENGNSGAVLAAPNDENINNRYQNKINENEENHAKEEMDEGHNAFGELDLKSVNNNKEAIKQAEKMNFRKKHIDALVKEGKDYDQDGQLEENEEDEDADDFDDHFARGEPADRKSVV